MVSIYKNKKSGRTKVFFVLDDKDKVQSVKMGNRIVSSDSGYQFYVDDYIAEQIEKFDFDFVDGKPVFKLLDGEELEDPILSEEEKEIKELEKRLKELKGD